MDKCLSTAKSGEENLSRSLVTRPRRWIGAVQQELGAGFAHVKGGADMSDVTAFDCYLEYAHEVLFVKFAITAIAEISQHG